MEHFIAFGIIFLTVLFIELIIGGKERSIPYDPLDINSFISTKKCPCCLKEIKADAIKCKNCGSLINVF
jgi:hypothetical protein